MHFIFRQLTLAVLTLSPLQGADWPAFRGPRGDGISSETLSGNRFVVRWKQSVGIGCSGISVVGNRAYTMGNSRDITYVLCLDANSGRLIWKYGFPSPAEEKNGPPFVGGPTATPTVYRGQVYALGRFGTIVCLNAASGDLSWKFDFHEKFPGRTIPQWGYSASPVVDGNRLYLEPGGDGHTTVCLDRKTGHVLWTAGDEGAAFSTPVIADLGGKRTLLAFTKNALVGREARAGTTLWSIPWKSFRSVHAASPLLIGNRYVFISTVFTHGGKLFDLSSGEPRLVWHNKKLKNYHTTCVHVDGHLYGFSQDDLSCINVSNGEIIWRHPRLGRGNVTAARGGRMLVQGDHGELVLAEINPAAFKPITSTEVFDEITYTAPTIANGRIFCRSTKGNIACLSLTD